MDLEKILKNARRFSKPFRVIKGDKFRLEDADPGDTLNLKAEDKPRAKEALAAGIEALAALQDMIRNTATKRAPWYVVPADKKWFTRVIVAAAVIDTLASLDLKYPGIYREKLDELAAAKKALLAEE